MSTTPIAGLPSVDPFQGAPPQDLQLTERVRDAQGCLLPGIRQYCVVDMKGPITKGERDTAGLIHQIWRYTLPTGEEYLTHGSIQNPPGSYNVSFTSRVAGSTESSHERNTKGHLTHAVEAGASTGEEGRTRFSTDALREGASSVVEKRTSDVQEIEFDVTRGKKRNGCMGFTSSLQLYFYTINEERRAMVPPNSSNPNGTPHSTPQGGALGSQASPLSDQETDRLKADLERQALVLANQGKELGEAKAIAARQQEENQHLKAQLEFLQAQAANMETRDAPLFPQAFGAEKWLEYFNVKVDPVPIPSTLRKKLESNEEIVAVLIPSEIVIPSTGKKEIFTFAKFRELLGSPKKGHSTKCSNTSCYELNEWGSSRWVAISKKSLRGMEKQDFSTQKNLMDQQHPQYRVPTAFEVAMCALLHKVATGETLFGKNPYGEGSYWIRCQKEPGMSVDPVVGGDTEDGLRVLVKDSMEKGAPNIGMVGVIQ